MNWDTTSKILGIASGLVYATAFCLYNRSVEKGDTKPVATTWMIWSFVSLVSAPSYFKTSGDVWIAVISLLNVAFCVGTLILSLKRGFNTVSREDRVALVIGIVAVISWKALGSAPYANLVVQAAIITGFVPLWRLIWKRLSAEDPLPWWIWSSSYVISIAVVVIRGAPDWKTYVYPVNCILLHASVPILQWVRQNNTEHHCSTR